jgi:hypothetical protein
LSVLSVVVMGISKLPNRCAIIALADGSYYSQSESEDEHNILVLSNENLQTCEYQAEDGDYELGLNCLAIQSIPHVASDDIPLLDLCWTLIV